MNNMQSELDRTFQTQFRALLQQINDFKHKRTLLQQSNKILESQSHTIKQQNLKQKQFNNQLSSLLKLLKRKTDIFFQEDHDQSKNIQNKEQITRYSEKIVDQIKIMNENVVNLPCESLQKVEACISNFTAQKVAEAIKGSREMRRTLERIEQTKEKFQKQRQAQERSQEKHDQQAKSERLSQFQKHSHHSD